MATAAAAAACMSDEREKERRREKKLQLWYFIAFIPTTSTHLFPFLKKRENVDMSEIMLFRAVVAFYDVRLLETLNK